MDVPRKLWYFSDIMPRMTQIKPRDQTIPVWHLYGEDSAFPDVLHIETITNRAAGLDWRIAPHRHPQLHQFFLILEGAATITLDGETLHATPPFLLNVPVGVVHGFTFAAGTKGWVLTIPVQTLPDLLQPSRTQNAALGKGQVIAAPPDFADLFHQIDLEHAASHPARSVMLRAIAAQLACQVLRHMDQIAPRDRGQIDQRFHQFQTLLDQHLRDRWRLPDFARAIGVSERHLGRICRSATGQSPADLIESAILHEACRLLVYTRSSVASVGYSLGFEDPSYFSRAFRRRMGLSPAAYRAGYEQD